MREGQVNHRWDAIALTGVQRHENKPREVRRSLELRIELERLNRINQVRPAAQQFRPKLKHTRTHGKAVIDTVGRVLVELLDVAVTGLPKTQVDAHVPIQPRPADITLSSSVTKSNDRESKRTPGKDGRLSRPVATPDRKGTTMPATRTLLLPVVEEAVSRLYELELLLVFMAERPSSPVPNAKGVPIPGAPISEVLEAYWRVLDAMPEGTQDLVDGTAEELPDAPMLRDLSGQGVGQLVTIEVAEADLALLAAFADALETAARPHPGAEFTELSQTLGELGRQRHYQWLPQADEATVSRWVRRSLALVLHSPFEGPHGASDHKVLSGVLHSAERGGIVEVDEDEEDAVGRVMLSMLRAAIGWPPEPALTT